MTAGRLALEFPADFWDVLPGRLLSSVEGYAAQFRVPVSRYFWMFPPHAMKVEELQGVQDGANLFPSTHHLLGGVVVAVVLSILRYMLHHLIFVPLGKLAMNIKVPPTKYDSKMERAYLKDPLLGADAEERAEVAGVDVKTLSRYFRAHRMEAFANKKLNKFSEACWRDLIYLAAIVCAVAYVMPQEWFKNLEECWRFYPGQKLPVEVYFYYAFELGIYLHLSVYQFSDTKRSDFYEMFVHHLATTALIVLSWLSGFVRIGTLVMFCHDVSDVFLETAKIFNYTSQARAWAQAVTDGCFVLFAVTFFITRLIFFPFWICRSTFTDAHRLIPPQDYPGMYIFYVLLCILQALHVFWFYLIARMAVKMIISGKVEKDVRSDDEEEECVSDDEDGEDSVRVDKKVQ